MMHALQHCSFLSIDIEVNFWPSHASFCSHTSQVSGIGSRGSIMGGAIDDRYTALAEVDRSSTLLPSHHSCSHTARQNACYAINGV